uniref:AP-3 complex subunit beta-2-like isoform X2 n=1 Tax=Monopterus albus TaxID=43700 RepID=UPI0009B2F5D3|nr:AP-3 complex subunit beta-2-like isoform X2 [Monopterus albus]
MEFTINTTSDTKKLHVEEAKLQSGMRVKEFPKIAILAAMGTINVYTKVIRNRVYLSSIDLAVDQSLGLTESTNTRKFFVLIQRPVGELMRPVILTENEQGL